MFKKRENVFEVEEGKFLSPKFDTDGLIPVTTTDSNSGDLLMHGYMNQEALRKTIETKEAHYWSRSKKALWHKGKTSGFIQKVIDLRIDDDQDALWMTVDIGNGASCHVGYKSCFYRSIPLGPIKNSEQIELNFKEKEKKLLTSNSPVAINCPEKAIKPAIIMPVKVSINGAALINTLEVLIFFSITSSITSLASEFIAFSF